MGIEETLRQPLHVPFGRGWDVPPPTARVALRVQKYTQAVVAALKDESVDVPAMLRSLGLDPDVAYSAEEDLLGELYEPMLDDLTIEEFGRVSRAMIAWSMPGMSREAAEASLADPTSARPKPNRATRRAPGSGSTKSAASKLTGTS